MNEPMTDAELSEWEQRAEGAAVPRLLAEVRRLRAELTEERGWQDELRRMAVNSRSQLAAARAEALREAAEVCNQAAQEWAAGDRPSEYVSAAALLDHRLRALAEGSPPPGPAGAGDGGALREAAAPAAAMLAMVRDCGSVTEEDFSVTVAEVVEALERALSAAREGGGGPMNSRELDARIAETLFGGVLAWEDGRPYYRRYAGQAGVPIPAYSSTWEGMGRIVEEMERRDWIPAFARDVKGHWTARFLHDLTGRLVTATGKSASDACARAALAALGEEEGPAAGGAP